MNKFLIQNKSQADDGIGGFKEEWVDFKQVSGYLDLTTGTDLNTSQNAFVEQSTHMLILPIYQEGITDNMRMIDNENRVYTITYADNPMNLNHHNEIYCKFSGDVNG